MYTTKEKKLTIHFIFPGSQMSDSNSSSLSGGHIHPEGLKDYDEEDSEDEEHNNHQYLVSRRKNCNEKKKILEFFLFKQ